MIKCNLFFMACALTVMGGLIMGKAEIVSGGDAGLYEAKILYDKEGVQKYLDRIDISLESLDTQVEDLEIKIDELEAELPPLETAFEEALAEFQEALEEYRSKLIDWHDRHDKWDGVDVPVNSAGTFHVFDWEGFSIVPDSLQRPRPDPKTGQESERPSMPDIPEMRDHLQAKGELDAKQGEIDRVKNALDMKKLEKAGLEKRRQQLNALLATLDEDVRSVWCADLSQDLSGEVQTMEVKGQPDQIILTPGYVDPDTSEPHWNMEAGALTPILGMTPAQAAFNWAILPGWQKWKPLYLVGEITAIDSENDTADVTFDDARSVAQNLPVAYWESYPAIPVEYMDCNSVAFAVGDRVVVEFANQNLEEPKVIGFETNPQPCQALIYYRVQLQYVDGAIVDLTDMSVGGVVTFETTVGEDTHTWERVDPEMGGVDPIWDYYEFSPRLVKVGGDWHEGLLLSSWDYPNAMVIDYENIDDFIRDVYSKGLAEYYLDQTGHVRILAYNRHDQRMYMFIEEDSEVAQTYNLGDGCNLLLHFYISPHDSFEGFFEELSAFAPTQGEAVKSNNRWYNAYYMYEGSHGNPSQNPEGMAIYPGRIGEPPPVEYLAYITNTPQIGDYKTENIVDIANCSGVAKLSREFYVEHHNFHVTYTIMHSAAFFGANEELGSEHLGQEGSFSPDSDQALDISMVVKGDGEEMFSGESGTGSEKGFLVLTPESSISIEKSSSGGSIEPEIELTVSGGPGYLYGQVQDNSWPFDWWWCYVTNTTCQPDIREAFNRFQISGFRTRGCLIRLY